MRITMFLLLFSVIQVMGENSYSQNTRLSLNLKDVSVEKVLDEIENQSEFYFLFNQKLVNVNRKVDINANNEPIKDILADIFAGEDVNCMVMDRQILLSPKNIAEGFSVTRDRQPQEIVVTGKVTDEDNNPLPGVNILIKGTIQGAITDADGNYSIEVDDPDATLVFSFIGYSSQEILINNQTMINVILDTEAYGLDEVIAIGYGSLRKVDLTGSVENIKGDIITDRNAIQVSQALQGAMSGVMVTRDNSAPGSEATIRIRGITTIGDSDPLIIVDGVPLDNINDVNSNDIESISVLKDAASASIYGARAASGVILITTKRANEGQLDMSYDFHYGFEKPTEWPDYVDAVRAMEIDNELRWNDNDNTGTEYPTFSQDLVENYWSLNAENPNLYPNTDWYGLIMKDRAPVSSHVLSISAGTKVIRTKVSLIFDKIDGLYDNKSYDRLNARVNNDITINKYLSSTIDLFVKRVLKNDAGIDETELIKSLHINSSIYPAVWDDGRLAPAKTGANPYGQVKYGGYRNDWNNKIGGKFSLNFTPISDLTLSAVIAPNFNFDKGKDFIKSVEFTSYEDPTVSAGTLKWATSTSLYETRNDNYQVTSQYLANYVKSFGNHNLNILGGYEYFYAYYESLSAFRDQYELTRFPYLDLGPLDLRDNSGSAFENSYRSWFGRVMYNYQNKYLLQSNIRFDGSSRFHKDYRWGSFPSFSAGWVISKESFMRDISWLSFLKLRGSWGSLGNERIGNYPYQSKLAFSNALFYQGSNVVSAQTAAQEQYAIQNISWERTESFDFGIDINMFDNRLRFVGDYYVKTTKDMLLPLEIPDYIGFDNPNQNTGKMKTKGWEAGIGWNYHVGDLKYSVSFNISDFKSIMGDLGGTEFLGSQIKIEGSEFNEWYGYKSDGLFQTQAEVDDSPTLNSSVKPGDVKYIDISGPDDVPDGIISPEYDRDLLGGSLPRYIYGGNIHLDYKGFDFNMVIQGVGKQNSLLMVEMVKPLFNDWGNAPAIIDGNYWSHYNTPEQNEKASYPRLSRTGAVANNYAMSDYWLFNGGYLRMKSITLGYRIPSSVTQKINIQGIRVYTSISDLFSIDNYPKGWDPEIAGWGYPITASYIFGISINF